MSDVQTVVVGAGVVGLAIARRLAASGREVLILEAEAGFGTITSARNSEVIHAGIYYPKGSLKAELCVAGRQLLYDYCESRAIPHRRCGKLIVATAVEQHEALEVIRHKACDNGVSDLEWISADAAAQLEPAIRCTAALLSPSTGIIDSHALMLSVCGEAESNGAMLAFLSPVERVSRSTAGGFKIEVGGDSPMTLTAGELVNAAGHHACALAGDLPGDVGVPVPVLAKGSYFALQGRSPASRLIYPLPEPGGLGVHLTIDLAGRARFGPDVEWVDTFDYAVDPARSEAFHAAIAKYWPDATAARLVPDYSGIRPKVQRGGKIVNDFLIEGPLQHGIEHCVNLYGIESPGLTASLAIAERVAQRLGASADL